MKYTAIVMTLALMLALGCSKTQVRNVEAIDDFSVYNQAEIHKATFSNRLEADVETTPIRSEVVGADAADDPAIWYHKSSPAKSVIFGTNKKKGIHSYDLDGSELQYLPYAPVNNIDIRQEVLLDGQQVDILAGSNRAAKSIDLFIIDNTGTIASLPDYSIPLQGLVPYGLCLYKNPDGLLHVFVNNSKGTIRQFSIQVTDGKFVAQKTREMKVPSQAEGMVADETTGKLYVAEEEKGIHIFDANLEASTQSTLLAGSTEENKQIEFDIEGLALLPPHHLLASSQGNFSYAVFDLETYTYLSSFTIADGVVDGVEETDGIEICPFPMGSDFPDGLLVVQDGWNREDTVLHNQNFKYIDLSKVLELIDNL